MARPMIKGDVVTARARVAEDAEGRVIQAGPATYTVEWTSGKRSRIAQGYVGVRLITAEPECPHCGSSNVGAYVCSDCGKSTLHPWAR